MAGVITRVIEKKIGRSMILAKNGVAFSTEQNVPSLIIKGKEKIMKFPTIKFPNTTSGIIGFRKGDQIYYIPGRGNLRRTVRLNKGGTGSSVFIDEFGILTAMGYYRFSDGASSTTLSVPNANSISRYNNNYYMMSWTTLYRFSYSDPVWRAISSVPGGNIMAHLVVGPLGFLVRTENGIYYSTTGNSFNSISIPAGGGVLQNMFSNATSLYGSGKWASQNMYLKNRNGTFVFNGISFDMLNNGDQYNGVTISDYGWDVMICSQNTYMTYLAYRPSNDLITPFSYIDTYINNTTYFIDSFILPNNQILVIQRTSTGSIFRWFDLRTGIEIRRRISSYAIKSAVTSYYSLSDSNAFILTSTRDTPSDNSGYNIIMGLSPQNEIYEVNYPDGAFAFGGKYPTQCYFYLGPSSSIVINEYEEI